MDEFTRIRTFIKVVETGSFSAAARDVSSVSSVARQVKALEDDLGARLLNRSTRSLSLTEAGRMFYERVTSIVTDLDIAKSEVNALQGEVRGVLRVWLRITAGTTVVVPALSAFLAQHPDLQVDITLTDERCDLIANNIDVALWLGALPNSEIVARRLSPTRRIVYGSPDYFKQRGVPTRPADLSTHNCLLFAVPSYDHRWSFTRDGSSEEVEVDGNVRSSNGMVLLASALAGIGVGIAHEWMVRQHLANGDLVKVLADYTVNPRQGDAELYAVFPSSRGLSRKVRAFVDFLIEIFKDDATPDSPIPRS
ncbi:LysR family transcriptional regulator [Achromobacter spanius]|uniref:LysR family transcriptional regulator n=1 Tax=Achromobacter spanius TaxID=217203 RepID=UPI0036E62BB7